MNLLPKKNLKDWLTPNLNGVELLAALLSGLVWSLAYPPLEVSFLIWIALIPFLLQIQPGWKVQNFWLGFCTGFTFYLLHLYWLWHASFPGMVALVFFLSFVFALQTLLFGKLLTFPFFLPLAALLWFVIEYLRSLGWLSFSWGYLGHALYAWEGARLMTPYIGVYGLSFFVAGINLCLAVLVKRYFEQKIRWWVSLPSLPIRQTIYTLTSFGALFFCLMLFSYWSAPHYETTTPFRVALIQGGFHQNQKESASTDDMVNRCLSLSQQALEDKPDLIIWPESTIPRPLNYDQDLLDMVLSFVNQADTELLLGTVHGKYEKGEGWDFWNRAALLSPGMEVSVENMEVKIPNLQWYHKVHLVPYGEWIPLGQYWPFYHIETLIEEAGAGLFQRGKEITLFETRKGITFSVAICFESTLTRQMHKASQEADFLVNITNDAWFKTSPGLKQHFIQSVFRAAENRRYLARAANTGITGVIDPRGNIVKTIPPQKPGFCVYELQLPNS